MTSLLDIWRVQKSFFEAKTIEQVISISGDGNMRDGNEASCQYLLLANLPATSIARYIDECLILVMRGGPKYLLEISR